MGFNSADIGSITKSALDSESEMWKKETEKLKLTGHPLEPEYTKISREALTTIANMSLALMVPSGYPTLVAGAERLQRLYVQAVSLRGQIAADNVRKVFRVPSGGSIESTFMPKVEKATEFSSVNQSINSMIAELVRALEVNPADVMIEGHEAPGNKFYKSNEGLLTINYRAVDAAREKVKLIRAAGTVSPDLKPIAMQLEQALTQVENIDPFGKAQDNWNKETFAGQRINWKPLQVFGGAFAALVTTIGLGQAAYTKNLSPITVAWAGVTMFAVNPGLFRGSGARSLEHLMILGGPIVHTLITSGFKGVKGVRAFEELQAKRDDKTLEMLKKQKEPLTPSQILNLTGGNKTPLYEVLMGLEEKQRVLALQTFGAQLSAPDVEDYKKMIWARV